MCWKCWGFQMFRLRKCSMTKNSARYYHVCFPLSRTPVSPCARPGRVLEPSTDTKAGCVEQFPALCSATSLQQLEVSCGGSHYSMDVGKCYESGLSPPMDVGKCYESGLSPPMDVGKCYESGLFPPMDVGKCYESGLFPPE